MLWESNYKGAASLHTSDYHSVQVPIDSSPSDIGLTAWQRKRRAVQSVEIGDALIRFQESGIEDVGEIDVIAYWLCKRKDSRWKDLARMALEMLSIPAMSTEPERVFSGAKITISDRRSRLGDGIIEALECCKSWEREGLIAGVHTEIQEMDRMLDALYQDEIMKQK